MDVSCPSCKAEYEFEGAQIPDDGVPAKCTQCEHVFRIKKGEPELPADGIDGSTGREWKLRQATGSVFSFRHLTTLQKWIVERKVSRADELSLTGESWKRLGDIAELLSSFQRVDEATHQAPATRPLSDTLPPSTEPPAVSPESVQGAPPSEPPALDQPQVVKLRPRPAPPVMADVAPKPAPAPPSPPRQAPPMLTKVTAPQIPRTSPPVRPSIPQSPARQPLPDSRGGALKWVVVVLLLGIGGTSAGWYFGVTLPEEERLKKQADLAGQLKREQLAKEAAEREAAAKRRAEDAERAKAEAEAPAQEDSGRPAIEEPKK